MKKSDIEKNINEAEQDKVSLLQELEEISDRVNYIATERKALTFSVKQGDPDATRRARSLDAELGHLRKKQAELAQQIEEIDRMLLAWIEDLHTAVIEELQVARDRAALKVVEGWIKLYTLQQEEQETANEIDRRKAEARDAEIKLHSLTAMDYPAGISFDSPIQFAEPANKLADLHHRRSELMARLGIG